MRLSITGIIIGAIVALIVYLVGNAITHFHHDDLIWGLIAILVWVAIAFSGVSGRAFNVDR